MKNYESIIETYKAAIPQLEAAIQQLTASRLEITTESLKDIVTDNSKSIRAQVLRIAAEDAKKIRPAKRSRIRLLNI